jgi:hypothetical protein
MEELSGTRALSVHLAEKAYGSNPKQAVRGTETSHFADVLLHGIKVAIPNKPFAALKQGDGLQARAHGAIKVAIPNKPFAALKLMQGVPQAVLPVVVGFVAIPNKPFAALKLDMMHLGTRAVYCVTLVAIPNKPFAALKLRYHSGQRD